jgi:hypothetical protein
METVDAAAPVFILPRNTDLSNATIDVYARWTAAANEVPEPEHVRRTALVEDPTPRETQSGGHPFIADVDSAIHASVLRSDRGMERPNRHQ